LPRPTASEKWTVTPWPSFGVTASANVEAAIAIASDRNVIGSV